MQMSRRRGTATHKQLTEANLFGASASNEGRDAPIFLNPSFSDQNSKWNWKGRMQAAELGEKLQKQHSGEASTRLAGLAILAIPVLF
eukprot:CAMPEP_0177609992 /NCGR_PEP_ID=MMETSP0419_2-20121207/19479_1 /TAXON_ID=582737 /ORGANISM="Tetraselmis sp., Strain GSL018" /LENGTH=86 /DNA_ID=CAMNT_0019105143 /DNA_START=51 /DNA_END=308 /DNA_ORIENTATION=-